MKTRAMSVFLTIVITHTACLTYGRNSRNNYCMSEGRSGPRTAYAQARKLAPFADCHRPKHLLFQGTESLQRVQEVAFPHTPTWTQTCSVPPSSWLTPITYIHQQAQGTGYEKDATGPTHTFVNRLQGGGVKQEEAINRLSCSGLGKMVLRATECPALDTVWATEARMQ